MEIKDLPGALIVGHLLDFRSRRLELLRRVANECGDLGAIRLGPIRAIIVSSAALARQILTERHEEFSPVPLKGMDGISALFGEGMVVAHGEKHRAQRKRVASAFSKQKVSAHGAVIADEADSWQRSIQDGREIDLSREVDRLTRRIARRTLFGIRSDGELDSELETALTQSARLAVEELARLLPMPGWVPTPHNVRFRRVINTLDRCLVELVRERRARNDGDDVLSALIREADRGLTDREVRDDLMSLFVAGNEATTSALFWCIFHLANDEALADDLRAETQRLGDRVPTAEDLQRIPLATAIFRESMRLYPASHVMLRRTTQEVALGGARIPANTFVMINGFMIHRDPELHDNPEEFRPERFQRAADKELTMGFIPFGAGPRTCIGNHFALLQGPLSLLVINRALRVTPMKRGNIALSTGFAIGPANEYRVKIRRL